MLLDELVAAIDNVKSRIELHQSSLRQSEALTRYSLIDPLLRALGWDTADPALVTPEYDVGGKRADYALLEGNQVVVFLEAKRLDENLAGHRSQVAAYASELGIKYPALTNGSEWEVYDNSKLVPIDQRRILTVSIANSPTAATALQLLLLWRPNLASGQPVAANEPIVAALEGATPVKAVRETQPPVPSTPSVRPNSVPNYQPNPSSSTVTLDWERLSDLVVNTGDLHPTAIRFPAGEEYSVQRWYDLVHHTAAWLWSKRLLTDSNIPVASSKRRYIVNTQDMHPRGNPFNHPVSIGGTPLILESNISSKASASNAKTLLNHCGQDPSSVLLKIE